ncbi:MAG: hypothetical protein M3198_16810 [Actinomycetota bacterium]|nr:hypothetical protein [Actinomycetota bacterium]
MTGAGAVAGVVLLEWSVGWIAAAAWTQSWSVVRRGHFRINGWGVIALTGLVIAFFRTTETGSVGSIRTSVVVFAVMVLLYLLVQYSRTDVPGVVVGSAATLAGAAALALTAGEIAGWPQALAAVELLAGAALLGAVTNGMLLGHWYLNQPGLKPWALARLTQLGIAATVATAVLGLAATGRLATASTEGSVLGLPGFGESFGAIFFGVWVLLLGFTGAVIWMAKRCINIRSIQSATGLYYVALLTAGVSEFVVRYLMVNAS